MQALPCSVEDVNTILRLYDEARKLQVAKNTVIWPFFDEAFIKEEIQQGKHWKLIHNDVIACCWVITFQDPEIWGDRDNGLSIYIHRIVTDPAYRGNRFIDTIVAWAKVYTASLNKKHIRLDTWGQNQKLIDHYISAGFTNLGIITLENVSTLPSHYQADPRRCLLEIVLP
jgi:hypothetical protein